MALTEKQRQLIAQNAPYSPRRPSVPVQGRGLPQDATAEEIAQLVGIGAVSPDSNGNFLWNGVWNADNWRDVLAVYNGGFSFGVEKKEDTSSVVPVEPYKGGAVQPGRVLGAGAQGREAVRASAQQQRDATAQNMSGHIGKNFTGWDRAINPYLDLVSAQQAMKQVERLTETEEKKEAFSKEGAREDDFLGQFGANYTVGDLELDADRAYGTYLRTKNPDDLEYAKSLEMLSRHYQKVNAAALDDKNEKLPWVTKTFAGNLPQQLEQIKSRVKGYAAGGVAGALVGGVPGAIKGAQIGGVVSSGFDMYDTYAGGAYRALLALGMDENVAREAANDEAFVLSLMDAGDAAFDAILAGGSKALDALGDAAKTSKSTNAAVKALANLSGEAAKKNGSAWLKQGGKMLAKQATGEFVQEAAQESASIANRRRNQSGLWGLIGDTTSVQGAAITGKDPEALAQMLEAGKQGAILSLMGGGTKLGLRSAVRGAANVVGRSYRPSDPLAAAMFGTPAQQATLETTQETPPNAAGERTVAPTGEDTTQVENPAQGTQTQDALMAAMFGPKTENAASGAETTKMADPENLARYSADIDAVFEGTYPSGREIDVGPTPGILQKYGAAALPVRMNQNTAYKIAYPDGYFGGKHNLGMSALKHLPEQIADPIAILTSNTQKDSLVIVTAWKDGDADIIIPIHLNKQGAIEIENSVASAYQTGHIDSILGPNDANVLYTKNNEDIRQLLSKGVQFPKAMADDILARQMLSQEGTDVNTTPDGVQAIGPSGTPAPTQESGHTNTVGAAETGFLTPDNQSTERVSNINSGAAAFTRREGEATGLDRADYDALFRYQTETEEQRRQYAGSLLYYLKDGERVFLGDLDPEGYRELVDYLTKAPAWNGVMTDTAMLIKQELQGRALADPMFQVPDGGLGVTQEDYTAWLQVLREHATDTGRGTQAWAAWTRRDNDHGQATELEAWENLENSNLSDEERREVFDSVVKYDQDIEQAKTTEDLASIIMRIADRRGTTHGLTGKQSKRLTNRARKALDSMSFAELKQLAYSSSAALTTDRMPADAGRKLKVIQILNMLSSPKTATTNLAGNTSFYGIDAMAMQGAAVLDMALSKLTGTRSVAMEGFWGSKQSRSDIVKAIRRSLAEITLDVDMGGEGRYQQGSRRTFKANGPGVFNTGTAADRFAERVLSVLERNMGYAMTTTDEGYKGAARSTAHATQKLVDEGKIKTKNKDYATDRADDLAKYRTFQRDGRLATTLQVIHDLLNMVGIGDSGKKMGGYKVHSFGVGDLVAPFTRVAGNLVSTAVDYNPAKAIQGVVEMVDTIRKARRGDINPAKQAKAVSDTVRGLTGTAISLAAMALVKAGLMKRAEDEDDEDVAALNQSEGMTGTQINVDAAMRWVSGEGSQWQAGDTLVDVSRLEPLNFLFSFGVELADNENDGILSTVGEVAGDAASAFVSAAGDLPVMGTVAGVAKDVLVYGDDIQTAVAENLGKTAISSVTPNIMAAAAKGLDDKQRSTYSGDGVRDVLLDTLLSRIPGARQTLPAVVNTLGEEKDNPGGLPLRLFNAMINPVGVNEYSQSAVSQEMERVREKTGETGFYPSKSIPTKLSYTKDGVQHEKQLTWEQRQQYQMARSGAQMSVSAAMLGSPAYRNADAKTQAALLDRAHDYANQFARGQVLGADSVEGWVRNSQTAQADIGVSQAEFFALYEKYGSEIMGGTAYGKTKRMVKAGLSVDQWAAMKSKVDADGSGNVKKSELETYIESHFPRAKWRQIFDAYKGGSNWKNPY